tara:strand:- start:62 stop:271 length:210 start_codon:yes stop_codon:yes gene_type:complete
MRTRNEMEMKYVWVLDYTNGRIYRYEITSNWNHGEWNPDSESIEDFLINQNHQMDMIKWMVTKNKEINK